MSALICGSLAYDTIMVFPDQFKNHILPDKVHMLNVSFLVPRMRREFGGCAGNIAYNLKLLGDDRWLVEHDALATHVDQGVRRAQVDGQVVGKHAAELLEHRERGSVRLAQRENG